MGKPRHYPVMAERMPSLPQTSGLSQPVCLCGHGVVRRNGREVTMSRIGPRLVQVGCYGSGQRMLVA
jgi:hypothetical protein